MTRKHETPQGGMQNPSRELVDSDKRHEVMADYFERHQWKRSEAGDNDTAAKAVRSRLVVDFSDFSAEELKMGLNKIQGQKSTGEIPSSRTLENA